MKINVDAQTETRLKEIAVSCNLSSETSAAEILEQQIKDKEQTLYWRERAEDMSRLKNMNQKVVLPMKL